MTNLLRIAAHGIFSALRATKLTAATLLTATITLTAAAAQDPVRGSATGMTYDDSPSSLRVMTWNVEWMYDHYTGDNRSKLAKEQSASNRERWEAKVAGVAGVIAGEQPDIVALQEIENADTLNAIRQALKSEHNVAYRYAFIEGTDSFTEQDVGLLFRSGLVSYRRQEQSKRMFDSQEYYNLSKHLFGEFRWADIGSPLTVLNVHLRATADAEDKRLKQAKLARTWLETQLAGGEDVILLGDMNSEHLPGQSVGDVAAIMGSAGRPQMVDLLSLAESPHDPTHLILEKQFDRIYVSQSLIEDAPGLDWVFSGIRVVVEPIIRGDRDGEAHWHERQSMPTDELDLSDHFPVVAEFERK